METPQVLVDWLTEKVDSHRWGGVREPRTVSHTWFRASGPRNMRAALSASIRPSEVFTLQVIAPNVEVDYVLGARNAVISVLLSQGFAPVLACGVTLFDFKPHEMDSLYGAFYAVAKEATLQLLGLMPDFEHNIVW